MTNSKHMPGPWAVAKHGRGEHGGIAIDATDPADGRDFEVCEVWGIDRDAKHDDRSRANARLIAAAPELLEALKRVVRDYEDMEDLAPVSVGCIECTAGTVPNHRNTGLCGYHAAKAAIALAEGRTHD
jgi:hypothetical protein